MKLKRPASSDQTYLVRVAFDGSRYSGWQSQPNARTVQETLERAFTQVTQQPVRLRGAGRTDAGVHALDLPADFTVPLELDTQRLARAWNATTPPDIVVLEVRRVPDGFSARHRAHRRTYRYVVLNREPPSPFLARFSWHLAEKLDINAVQQAMDSLLGEHDFSSFRAASCEAAHPVRKIVAADVCDLDATGDRLARAAWWPFAGAVEQGLVCITITGTAFLKHQVRVIVGTLAQVGQGKMTPREFADILAARDRRLAGPTAPANGLTLVEVMFPPGVMEIGLDSGEPGAAGGTDESA